MVRYPFCSLPQACTLAIKSLKSPDLGLYSGLFAMYLQYQFNKSTQASRTTTIVFYAICLLYALSTVDFVSDLVGLILVLVSNNSICNKNIVFYQLWSRVSG